MLRVLGASGAALLLLSGCASSNEQMSVDQMEHVHSVAADGGNFYLASHHGLYELNGESWSLIGEEFDIMGLDISDGVFYASGHPGPTQNWADPIGIITSVDRGKTWNPKTFMGEVDFHLLEVSGDYFVGVAANYGVVVGSSDGAESWLTLETPSLDSLSVNPKNGSEILIISEGMLLLSRDAGLSFDSIEAPDNLLLVDWNDSGVFVGTDRQLFFSGDLNQGFSSNPAIFNNIQSVSAQGKKVIVLDEDGVHISEDAGESFRLLP
jgi:hypothetical protein